MKRYDLINLIINKYGLESYLEIGVHQKECFNKVECELKHCVDPNFPADYAMTSDEFFKSNDGVYELIFIDGLHTSEQTYTDIENAYNVLDCNGFIIVHDCNPQTEWHTRPVKNYKRGEEWNGGTYRGFIKYKQ